MNISNQLIVLIQAYPEYDLIIEYLPSYLVSYGTSFMLQNAAVAILRKGVNYKSCHPSGN